MEKTLQIRTRSLPPEYETRLRSEDRLGKTYLKKGEIDQAIELLEKMVHTRRTMLEPDHSGRQISQDLLANALERRDHGQRDESQPSAVPAVHMQDQADTALAGEASRCVNMG